MVFIRLIFLEKLEVKGSNSVVEITFSILEGLIMLFGDQIVLIQHQFDAHNVLVMPFNASFITCYIEDRVALLQEAI